MTTVSSTGSTSTASTTASTASTSTSSTKTSSQTAAAKLASSDTSTVDWDAIIESSVQAKLDKADTIDTKVTANKAKITAYTSFQSLLSTLKTAGDALRAPSGTTNASTDVFQSRTAYLTASGGVDTADTVSVSADAGAQLGTHTLTIAQIAKAQKVASTATSDVSTALGLTGSFSLGTEDGSSATIEVTATMTLADLVEKINAQASTTGVQATALKVSDSAYEMVLSTADTGETITTASTSGTDALKSLGVTDGEGGFADELQASQDAQFSLDGVSLTRSSNTVSDVLDGVTFQLYAPTGSASSTSSVTPSINVEISTNLSTVQTAVQSFVTAYNAVRDSVIGQSSATQDDGTASPLYMDGTVRSIDSALQSALNATVGGVSLSSLGLSFNEKNELELDSTTLDNALTNDLDTVSQALSFGFNSSSTSLKLLARGDSVPSAFTLDVTTDATGALTGASVGGDSSLFTVTGSRIVGKAGTPYEGLSLVYTGTASQGIAVTTTSGIAERVYNAASAASSTTSGSLQTLIDDLTSQDTDLTTRSDDIKSKAEDYRTTLTARYAKIQAAIASANSTQYYLTALLDAQNSSSS